MAVIIDEIIAEPQAGQAFGAPQPSPNVAPDTPVKLDQLRFDMLRDAHRQARIWVD